MGQLYQRYVWLSLLAGSAIAVLVAGAGLLAWQTAPMRVFAEARERWSVHPIPRYRLIIERPSLHCQQDVEVEDERIVQVFRHDCPIEMLTVTALFERIADLDGSEPFGLFASAEACGCEAVLDAQVVFDATHGYPVEVGIADRRKVGWQEASCWRYMLVNGALPACDVPLLFTQPRLTTIQVIPLHE